MSQAVFFNNGKESLVILHKYMKNSIIVCIDDDNDFSEIKEYVHFIIKKFNIKKFVKF
jgi:hypothetical protein